MKILININSGHCLKLFCLEHKTSNQQKTSQKI